MSTTTTTAPASRGTVRALLATDPATDQSRPPTPTLTAASWATALVLFTEHLKASGTRHATRSNYRAHLHSLAHAAPDGPWLVTADTVAAWLATRGGSRRTAWAVARLFYAWAERAGHLHGTNPCPPAPPRKPAQAELGERFPEPWRDPSFATPRLCAPRAPHRAALICTWPT